LNIFPFIFASKILKHVYTSKILVIIGAEIKTNITIRLAIISSSLLFKLSFAKQYISHNTCWKVNEFTISSFHWQESTRVELLLYTGGAMTLVENMLPADPF
jgi:hypothetical protein